MDEEKINLIKEIETIKKEKETQKIKDNELITILTKENLNIEKAYK